jgi:hypothetical protein
MKNTFLKNQLYLVTLKPQRLVFQGVDKAPPSPESFKGPEKQSEASALNEVASQSPSQIFNDTISAGGVVQARYQGSTTVLANLAGTDPIFTGQSTTTTSSNGTVTTTTASGITTTTPPVVPPPQK